MKFNDTNGNGVKNAGELGMGGWTITLNPGNLTMVTAPDGTYAFTDLTPGIYELTETMQPGWGQTYPGDTGIQEVMVHSGETVIDVDFGNFELGIIRGFKFNDYNGNGVRNAGEPKLQGWRIILINLQTGRQQFMLTNASGNYQFTGLLPGRYILREQMKPLWLPSAPANGMYTVVIDASGQILQRNFGNRQIPLPRRR
jgi:hypothetical protein